ncbi:prephenate dehydrogenase [Flavobacteriaceae bacterium F08102]|nr:prephenate dehydrogenase [Flavobacteriaceae bacterium F08102]
MEKVVVIGLGLIGGSMALSLKQNHSRKIIGIDLNSDHAQQAINLGIVDKIGELTTVSDAAIVIIAVPVDAIPDVAVAVLDLIGTETLVFDVGSVKERVCDRIKDHPKRGNFVAAHPIAGTEYSGPEAAFIGLFKKKRNMICEPEKTHPKLLEKACALFEELEMKTEMMCPLEHDKHIAYVSHLSHISSFMLGKTVLEIEPNEATIFAMAGSGFESTVRLAKSSPAMWAPIFMQNKTNVLKSLEEYIRNLETFKKHIENHEKKEVFRIMEETNRIKNILNGISK